MFSSFPVILKPEPEQLLLFIKNIPNFEPPWKWVLTK